IRRPRAARAWGKAVTSRSTIAVAIAVSPCCTRHSGAAVLKQSSPSGEIEAERPCQAALLARLASGDMLITAPRGGDQQVRVCYNSGTSACTSSSVCYNDKLLFQWTTPCPSDNFSSGSASFGV